MSSSAWGLLALFVITLLLASWPLGLWIARISNGRLPGWMLRTESLLYRLAGNSADQSMKWSHYALALLAFNALGVLVVYAFQRLQAVLPLNPAGMAAVSPDSSFNTALSFVANTNWQGYAGEATMSYFTQMTALAVQNFFSAATGIAVVFALIRGFASRKANEGSPEAGTIGNFWVDITRITAWLLLPLSLAFAIFLVGQGVIQNFDAYKDVSTLEVTKFQQAKTGADGQPVLDAKGAPVMEDTQTDKQTFRSQHNQIYWAPDGEWYAVGMGATSFVNGCITERPRTLVEYQRWVESLGTNPDDGGDGAGDACDRELDLLMDHVLKRLRTSEGLSLDWILEKFGSAYHDAILKGAELGMDLELARIDESNRLRLKDPDGFLFSNSIISSIFVELENVTPLAGPF